MTSSKFVDHARPYAFKYLYHLELLDENDYQHAIDNLDKSLEEFEESYLEDDSEHTDNQITPQSRQFARNLITGVIKNYQEVNQTISKHLTNWKIDELDRVDLTLIRLGCFELTQRTDFPFKVIISEVIRLAQRYGNESSYSLINGVLDKIAKEQN